MGWVVVSFYTSGTGYETEIRRLVDSATKLGIPIRTYPTENRGSWRINLNFKSAVILRAMDEFPEHDIVWIDADGVIRRRPTLFDELSDGSAERGSYDIAFHRFKQSRLEPGTELLSGTLWIANRDVCHRIIRSWHEYAVNHPEIRHQKALDCVLRADPGRVRVFPLPIEYCAIFDHPAVRGRIQPVIEHFQASRRYRRAMGGGRGPIPIRRTK